jgi:hypothetical protein
MQIRSVGIDLGKTTFHLVALGDNGKVLLKKKFTQRQVVQAWYRPRSDRRQRADCGTRRRTDRG